MADQIYTTSTRKIVLVTGGGRGLGRSTALNLARRSISSVITYKFNRDEAETVAELIRQAGGNPPRK